jgi:hypothetical protein
MNKGRNLMMLVAVAALIALLFTINNRSAYSVSEREYAPFAAAGPTAAGPAPEGAEVESAACNGMQKGTGLASSLLPREVATSEDFGQFAPDDVLKGQNFLEPRQQVGFPETVGGALRNANQQIRADPPNPKDPYVWNNSTIVPDLMQRTLGA